MSAAPAPRHRWPGWWRRVAMLLAHAQPAALLVVIGTETTRHLTDRPAVALAHAVAVVVTVLGFLADGYHQVRLCSRCAAATPADGAAAAQQHRRALRCHHWATDNLAYPLVLIAAAVAYFGFHAPHWVTFYPVYALWATVAYANLRHRPLEPWCPQCFRWGWGTTGDDKDPVPPPIPAGVASATASAKWSAPEVRRPVDHAISRIRPG